MKFLLKYLLPDNKEGFSEILPGLTVGRKGADILVNDKKVSSQHAKISTQLNSHGHYILQDLGSRNKIKIQNRRFDQIELSPGSSFFLGDTSFTVILDKGTTWSERTQSLLELCKHSFNTSKTKSLSVLNPPLVLRSIEAPQQSITITYTPWSKGFIHWVDIVDGLVEIYQDNGQCHIRSLQTDKGPIFINQQPTTNTPLHHDDILTIRGKVFKVVLNESA